MRRDPEETAALIQSAMEIDLLLILKSTGKERGGQRDRVKSRRAAILKAPTRIANIGGEDTDKVNLIVLSRSCVYYRVREKGMLVIGLNSFGKKICQSEFYS